jgi:UTP--glucose-1-phosphate uridylyltransferase
MKVVIPVAGLGTRMLPATKAIPKEMLPLVDKPLIQYIVNECYQAGFKELVFVTHASKNSIENHFDTSFELESMLEKRVKRQLLDEVRSIAPNDLNIVHVRQGEAKGLGHAVLCARSVIGDAPFAVVLPDVLIEALSTEAKPINLGAMRKAFEATGESQVMVEQVQRQAVSNYGIVDFSDQASQTIGCVVEKPSVEAAPSNWAVVGRYVFSADLWQHLEQTPPDHSGEIQLTDAIASQLKSSATVKAYSAVGPTHDCGQKLSYVKTFIRYALQDPLLGAEVAQYIQALQQQ